MFPVHCSWDRNTSNLYIPSVGLSPVPSQKHEHKSEVSPFQLLQQTWKVFDIFRRFRLKPMTKPGCRIDHGEIQGIHKLNHLVNHCRRGSLTWAYGCLRSCLLFTTTTSTTTSNNNNNHNHNHNHPYSDTRTGSRHVVPINFHTSMFSPQHISIDQRFQDVRRHNQFQWQGRAGVLSGGICISRTKLPTPNL